MIVASLIPATGEFALVARLVRVLRVLRLISAVPQLRLIVATLVRSIPSMGHVIMLMSIIFYIYAVTGFHLFHEHDAEHWGTLGARAAHAVSDGHARRLGRGHGNGDGSCTVGVDLFREFIMIGTFVVLNLFIAVVINNLDASKVEQLEELREPVTHDEVLRELERTRDALARPAAQDRSAAYPRENLTFPAAQRSVLRA